MLTLYPAFRENNIPIIFSVDKNFIPYLYIAIQSLISNSNKQNNYDINILYSEIDEVQMSVLKNLECDNVSIRFIDMTELMEQYKDCWYVHDWGTGKWHSNSVYYRFFIPMLFKKYNKAVFLDGDIIVNCDISELYQIDLKENLLGAVQDFARFIKGDHIARYSEEKLKVPASQYFNAGILLLNIEYLSKINFLDRCLAILDDLKKPLLNDQDVFNVFFKDKVLYLDFSYNCLFWSIYNCHSNPKDKIPPKIYEQFLISAQNPKIVHYAGSKKPWKEPQLLHADIFWKYARMTPFYETILSDMIRHKTAADLKIVNHTLHRTSYKIKYYKYKILKHLTFGKKRKKYKEKQRKYKTLLKQIKQYFKSVK